MNRKAIDMEYVVAAVRKMSDKWTRLDETVSALNNVYDEVDGHDDELASIVDQAICDLKEVQEYIEKNTITEFGQRSLTTDVESWCETATRHTVATVKRCFSLTEQWR